MSRFFKRDASDAAASCVRDAGGFLQLLDALQGNPDAILLVLNRVSFWDQAGRGKVNLQEKTDAVVAEVRKLAPDNLLLLVGQGVEEGKLSKPRPTLVELADFTWQVNAVSKGGAILVASDLSRFLRSEAFDHITNREAWPTPEEFAKFHKMTFGVVCATLADPLMTEAGRHSLATKRTKKCGRPREPLNPLIALQILEALGTPFTWNRRIEWETPIAVVAKRFGVSTAKVWRFLGESVPEVCLPDNQKGMVLRWKDINRPAEAYRVGCEKLGWASYLHSRSESGEGRWLFD
jgi:hypothetical protein